MLPQFLVEETLTQANGEGPVIEIGPAQGGLVMLTLSVTRVIEQESFDLAIIGSVDGQEWPTRPVAAFPQKFYTGTSQLLVDLRSHPDVRFLRARWQVSRWGRGTLTPLFGFYVFAQDAAAVTPTTDALLARD